MSHFLLQLSVEFDLLYITKQTSKGQEKMTYNYNENQVHGKVQESAVYWNNYFSSQGKIDIESDLKNEINQAVITYDQGLVSDWEEAQRNGIGFDEDLEDFEGFGQEKVSDIQCPLTQQAHVEKAWFQKWN